MSAISATRLEIPAQTSDYPQQDRLPNRQPH